MVLVLAWASVEKAAVARAVARAVVKAVVKVVAKVVAKAVDVVVADGTKGLRLTIRISVAPITRVRKNIPSIKAVQAVAEEGDQILMRMLRTGNLTDVAIAASAGATTAEVTDGTNAGKIATKIRTLNPVVVGDATAVAVEDKTAADVVEKGLMLMSSTSTTVVVATVAK